jgi:hypothetical protein
MKKLTLLVFAALILSPICTFAQYHSIKRTVIQESEVPSEIIDAQRKQFYNGFVTEWQIHEKDASWENDLTHYMATFKKDGRFGNYAYYSPKGTLYAYSLFVNPFDLGESIQELSQKSFEGSRIKSAELIDIEDPQVQIYRVRMNNEGQLNYLYFDINGNRIDKNQLPVKIFTFL